MTDKYRNFAELSKRESLDRDFRIRFRKITSAIVIVAPHGGQIEPGTSEIADAIAAEDCSFYTFEGIKARGNRDLHVTSTRFDEPSCSALLKDSIRVISVHGEESEKRVVFLGGRGIQTLKRLRNSLEQQGFCVRYHPRRELQGWSKANVCNRGQSGVGVQLELSKGLRRSFFKSLSQEGRRTKTRYFRKFVDAVRAAILAE